MDILESLQYWMLMIFLQFGPLDGMEKDAHYKYFFVDAPQITLDLSVIEVERKKDITYLQIQASYVGAPASHTHIASLEGRDSTWYLTGMTYNQQEILKKGERVAITRYWHNQDQGIMISTDSDYRLKKINEDAVTYLYPPQLKRSMFNKITFAKDGLSIDVFSSDSYPLGGVVVNDTASNIHKEIRWKKDSKLYIGRIRRNVPLAMKNPSEYCLEDGYLYHSSDFSFMGLFLFAQHEKLDELVGHVVVAEGNIRKDITEFLNRTEKCPPDYGKEQSMMQMRSDWVGEETGFKIGYSTMEKLSKLSYFMGGAILEYNGLTTEKKGGNVTISFTNTLEKPIDELEIVAHYESSMGKPVASYISKKFSNLAPGKTATATFQGKYTDENDHKKYKFCSFEINGTGENISISID